MLRLKIFTWIKEHFSPKTQDPAVRGSTKNVQHLTTVKCKVNLLLVFLELVLPRSSYSLLHSLVSILCFYLFKKTCHGESLH